MADRRIELKFVGEAGPRVRSMREKLEGRATREILAAAGKLADLVDEFRYRQPDAVVDATADLRAKLAKLDEIRTGA